jgi:hypothetical protein
MSSLVEGYDVVVLGPYRRVRRATYDESGDKPEYMIESRHGWDD